MEDRAFLEWLHERLIEVHGESPLHDYMHKLRAIVAVTPSGKVTPNTLCANRLSDLQAAI